MEGSAHDDAVDNIDIIFVIDVIDAIDIVQVIDVADVLDANAVIGGANHVIYKECSPNLITS